MTWLGKSDEKKSKDKEKSDLITNYENEKKRADKRAKKSK